VLIDDLVERAGGAALLAAAGRFEVDDFGGDMDGITGAERFFKPHIIKADAADEVDIGIDIMIHLTPQRQNMNTAGHHAAEYRGLGQLGIGMEPLRIIELRKADDFVLGDGAALGAAGFAEAQVFKGAAGHHDVWCRIHAAVSQAA